MTTPVVPTFIGHDRSGLVNIISQKVAAAGGTWLESRLAHLAGEFAGIVLIGIPEANIAGLAAALRELEPAGLRISIEASSRPPTPPGLKTVKLALVGAERPGIVRDITQALTGPWGQYRGICERRRKSAVFRRRNVPCVRGPSDA